MFQLKNLSVDYINSNMLLNFHHNQIINNKYVNINNKWEVTYANEVRVWNKEKRIWISEYLRQQIQRGGFVIGAFNMDLFVGFCCIDGYLYGKTAKYANLIMLFVDDEWKRKGIGKALFKEICKYAKKNNAKKLFISAIPSVETIAFYFAMGCIDAKEIITDYIDTKNDRYLEYLLI
ncbi:GNAT family N-acetyltransferase [Lachnospiraceae bacterium 48-33]